MILAAAYGPVVLTGKITNTDKIQFHLIFMQVIGVLLLFQLGVV